MQGDNHVPRGLFLLSRLPILDITFLKSASRDSDTVSMLVSLLMAAQRAGMDDSVKDNRMKSASGSSYCTSVVLNGMRAFGDARPR